MNLFKTTALRAFYSIVVCLCLFLASCTNTPKGIDPVKNFELPRYLGKWYEIARLDHSFERGLNQVTASYSMRDDGGVKVLNRGFNEETQSWKEAEGKAYFVKSPDIGHLKVSFFGPFYGAYIVFKLDQENYQYAYVSSYNREYLWLLSRTATISEERKQDFIQTVESLGFDKSQLIFVEHTVAK